MSSRRKQPQAASSASGTKQNPVTGANEPLVKPLNEASSQPVKIIDISQLGVIETERFESKPVVVKEIGNTKVMDFSTVRVKERIQQPILSIEEARALKQLYPDMQWTPFSCDLRYYTCVINWKRYLLPAEYKGSL